MGVRDDVIVVVPIGAAHKKAAKEIWQQMGVWALQSVKHHLELFADEGLIVRTVEKIPGGVRHLFHRMGA